MTTISVPGKIVAIEVEDDFIIVPLVGGSPQASATTVSPSGTRRTVVTTPGSGNANTDFYFKLDASFNLGDVVEMYATTPGLSFGVVDENGIFFTGAVSAVTMRKILTGTPGVPTWGVIS